jgi:hypothetical protein
LDSLKPLFERGGTTEAAARFFDEVYQMSLGDEYWAWVKNQAMEKAIPLDGFLLNPCNVQRTVIGTPQEFEYPVTNPDGPNSLIVTETLSRLTARVVPIKIKEDVGRTTITAGRPDGLAYKVYLDGDPKCAEVDTEHPEYDRTFESLKAGSTIYVILANTQHEPGRRVGYTLEVKPALP